MEFLNSSYQWLIIIIVLLIITRGYTLFEDYKKNKVFKISTLDYIILLIIILSSVYLFVYKPYFTTMGQIRRETKLEEKTLYYACALPKDNELYIKFSKECGELKLRAKYESEQQNCSPDYMGGCN